MEHEGVSIEGRIYWKQPWTTVGDLLWWLTQYCSAYHTCNIQVDENFNDTLMYSENIVAYKEWLNIESFLQKWNG